MTGRATPYRVRDREVWLREHLPGLHVGRSRSGTWHVLDARYQEPLCYVGQQAEILEDGPLESSPDCHLCAHCVRKQGDEYGEW